MAILCKKDRSPNIRNIKNRNGGRYIIAKIRKNRKFITLANVYAPTNYREKAAFFDDLSEKLSKYNDIFLGGDFNLVLETIDRIAPTQATTVKDREGARALGQLLVRHSLVDSFREKIPRHSNLPTKLKTMDSSVGPDWIAFTLKVTMKLQVQNISRNHATLILTPQVKN